MINKQQQYKSGFSLFFYSFLVATFFIAGFTTYQLIISNLTFGNFVFILGLVLLIAFTFSFQYDCIITVKNNILTIKYLSPFKRSVIINTTEITEILKYDDSIHRYYKKLYIKTALEDYLLKYSISDASDEDLLKMLKAKQ
jgi:hypothetical protein